MTAISKARKAMRRWREPKPLPNGTAVDAGVVTDHFWFSGALHLMIQAPDGATLVVPAADVGLPQLG